MTQDFEHYRHPFVPPVYVTTKPSLFKYMRPHEMPVYKPPFISEECVPYACIPYQRDECNKFK
jgi:hypothetical protein